MSDVHASHAAAASMDRQTDNHASNGTAAVAVTAPVGVGGPAIAFALVPPSPSPSPVSSAAPAPSPSPSPSLSPSSSLPLHSPLSQPVSPLSSPALSGGGGSGMSGEFPLPSSSASLSGLLWKKGSTFGGWTKRHYRLHPELSRMYYSKGEEGAIRGEILLHKFSVHDLAAAGTGTNATQAASLAGQFRIECPNKVHVLRVDDPAQLGAWITALQDLARANHGRLKESAAAAAATAQESSRGSNATALQSSSRCANCKESFGMTGKKLLCAACGFVFCNSLQCMEAKSLHGHNSARCCVNCAAKRDAAAPSPLSDGSSPLHRQGTMRSLLGRTGSTRMLSPGGGGGVGVGGSGGAAGALSPKQRPSNANLLIRVMAGRHLMVCDANGFSDPYVVIFFDQQEYRTEIQFQTLNPVWDTQFCIPVRGYSRDIQIGVYDSDRYSNDDFMIHIPLSQLENDKVFEDWSVTAHGTGALPFPLKGRPGKKSDKSLAISGAIHMQIVLTESLFSLFAPVWTNQLAPEEKFSQAVLKHNVKRVQNVVESLHLGWWQLQADDILNYKSPMRSLIVLLALQALVLFFPAEWILPSVPLLLLTQLAANFIADKKRLVAQLEATASYTTALMQARNAGGIAAAQAQASAEVAQGALTAPHNGGGGGGGDDDPNGAARRLEDEEEEEEEEEEEDDDKRAALGFLGKIRQYQKQLAKVQTSLGKVCDKIEAVQNLFRWHDHRRSKMVAAVLIVATLFLLLVPFRLLLFVGVTGRWSKKLLASLKKRRPRPKKPSEVDNFLERAQTAVSINPQKIHLVEKLRKS